MLAETGGSERIYLPQFLSAATLHLSHHRFCVRHRHALMMIVAIHNWVHLSLHLGVRNLFELALMTLQPGKPAVLVAGSEYFRS